MDRAAKLWIQFKEIQRKQCQHITISVYALGRDLFRTLSNIYDGKFFKKVFFFFYLHIYTFKTTKYNHQVRKYQCTWDPSKKGLNKEQRIIIYENIC